VGHLVQPSCRSRVTYSRLHRTASRRVLKISRAGESTTPLGSLFQGSVTLRVKKFFLMFSWNFLCFSLCPLPLVLSLGTTEKSLAPSPDTHPSDIYKVPSQPSLLQLNKPSSLSLSSQDRYSSPLTIIVALRWTLSSSSSSFLNWGAQNCTPDGASLGQSRGRGKPPLTCWPHSS